jgi:DNA topoisomerase-1
VTVPDDDAASMAIDAGLRYGSDAEPGIARRRCGRGFTFVSSDRHQLDDATRARIDRLAIPPAWTDVWISADPDCHLQATGVDDRGRKQYRYHDRWREIRDEAKFDALVDFAASLSEVRRRVESDLSTRGLGRDRVTAAVVRLLDTTLIRVGSERYAAENETFGATTLEPGHVVRRRSGVRLEFVGKANIERSVPVTDADVVGVIRACLGLDRSQLFCFETADGSVVDLTAAHVNDYLVQTAGATAKTFRTWGATTRAVEHLARTVDADEPVERRFLAAVDVAAEALGNTRAVCRSCYVAPAIAEAVETGALAEAWASSRGGRWRTRAESTTAKLLSTTL